MALKLKGSTSGFVAIDAPSVAGNNTLILPENTGSAHQILANDITAGVTTFTQVTVSRNGDLTVPGTISIGGTLTYEDVTSVDSVGIVTARSGVRINGGGLTIIGDTTGLNATGISTLVDVSARNVNVSGVSTFASTVDINGDTTFGASGSITAGANFTLSSNKFRVTGSDTVGMEVQRASNATIQCTETTNSTDLQLRANATGGLVRTATNKPLILGTYQQERVRITGAGSVGINTDNPNRRFTLYQDTTTRMNLKSLATSTVGIEFGDPDDENIGYIVYDNTDNSMQFGTNASQRLRMDSDGRIGIQGSPTKGVLDVRASGGSATMLTAVFGANEGQTGGSLSDNADKGARVGLYHYDTDEEPYALFASGASNGVNALNFGGGTSLMNAATSLGFYTAANSTTVTGTKRMSIDSSGRLQVGSTNTPSENQFNGIGLLNLQNNSADGTVDFTQGIVFTDNSSNEGTWTHGGIVCTGSTGYNGNLIFGTDSTGGRNMTSTSITEKMRLNSAGALLINSTSQSNDELFKIFTSSTVNEMVMMRNNSGTGTKDMITMINVHNSGAVMLRFKQTGSVSNVGSITTSASATAYNTSSDYRLKENIVAISDGITRLKTLKPYRFNFKVDPDKTVDGFLAHEVTAVPEAIHGTKDAVETTHYEEGDTIPEGKSIGDIKEENAVLPQSLDYAKLTPLLTAALQEAITEIETLKARLDSAGL